MGRVPTANLEQVRGVRRLLVRVNRHQYGGVVPGIFKVLAPDLNVLMPTF